MSQIEDEKSFIDKAAEYWQNVPATNNGVLGGFGHLHPLDIAGSSTFLSTFLPNLSKHRAVDCGAGVGRISRSLLCPRFDKVDLVEQDAHFVEEAKRQIGSLPQMDRFLVEGLQTWTPEPLSYSLIWIQWVSSHLTNERYVEFLERCKSALLTSPSNDSQTISAIVVKENMANSGEYIFDDEDSSVTRSEKVFKVGGVVELWRDRLKKYFLVRTGALRQGRSQDHRRAAADQISKGTLPCEDVCSGSKRCRSRCHTIVISISRSTTVWQNQSS